MQDNAIAINDSISFNVDFAYLIGKWKEIQYEGNNGSTEYVTEIENGRTFIFNSDHSFVMIKNNIKIRGKFKTQSNKIDKMRNDWLNLQISLPSTELFYFVQFKESKIELTPVNANYSAICDEGCAEIFEKIN